jgi:predicted small secreted protein
MKAFHEFLHRHYPSKAEAVRHFGIANVDWLTPNEWESPAQPDGLAAINDPVLQEWVRFRCESLANYANDLSAYVKSLNSNTVVYMNIKGVYSFNRYWANAVYHPLYAGHVDIIAFDTGGYEARIDANTGALVSQIRSYKAARQMNVGCDEPMGDELHASIQMAFGHQITAGGYAGAPWVSGANSSFTPSLEFFRHYNSRYYTGVEGVADVAVLRNWPSMAYSINATYTPATLMEQVLIQHHVPFDILFDEQFDRISHYSAVILAGQECVSDVQVKALLDYAEKGGTLVIADNTAQFNQWREKRRNNPFLPARKIGTGQIVYIPKITRAESHSGKSQAADDQDPEPGATPQKGARMTPSQWVLPKNHLEIIRAISDSLPHSMALTCDAPLTTVMEIVKRPETHETIAHFINFDTKNATESFKTTVRTQFKGAVKSVQRLTPDLNDAEQLKFEQKDDLVTVTVPQTRVYSMIVITQ